VSAVSRPQPHTGWRAGRGYTIIELAVAVGLLAILLILALPIWQGAIRERRVVKAAEEIAGLLRFAQQAAVADAQQSCGYRVEVSGSSAVVRRIPRAADGRCEAPGASIRRADDYPDGVTVAPATVDFGGAGGTTSGAAAIGVSAGDRIRYVRVHATTGRVEVSPTP
jgi:Tfp pilus assembly protein FimT